MVIEDIIAEILEDRHEAILEKDYDLLRKFSEENYGKVSEKALKIVIQRARSFLFKQINFLKTGKEILNSNSAEIEFAKRFLLPKEEESERISKMFEGASLFTFIVVSEIVNLLPKELLISQPNKVFETLVNIIGSFYEDLWLSSMISLRNDHEILENKIGQILKSQDKDKERLANLLYDELIEPLNAQNVFLEQLFKEDHISPENSQKLITAIETVKVILANVRNFSHYNALEFKEDGIFSAVHSYIKQFEEKTSIEVDLISDNCLPKLDSAVATNLLRIFEEAFRNIKRHSGADHVFVRLFTQNKKLFILISDNGRGFDVQKEVFTSQKNTIFNRCGIVSMKYRAKIIGGMFKISSQISIGTTVEIEIPVNKENTGSRKEILLVSSDTGFIEKLHHLKNKFLINQTIPFEKFSAKLLEFNNIPAMLILDTSNSGFLPVYETYYNLIDRFPNLKLVLLVNDEKEGSEFLLDPNLMINALILKDSFLSNPEETVKTIKTGKVLIDEAIWSTVHKRKNQSPKINISEKLSQRELEVLILVAKGHTNIEIAKELFISISTVKNLLANIYRKLDCSNRAEAASKMLSGI